MASSVSCAGGMISVFPYLSVLGPATTMCQIGGFLLLYILLALARSSLESKYQTEVEGQTVSNNFITFYKAYT